MWRRALDHLAYWKDRASRRPLVLRGARQVGKSTLVRLFAEQSFDHLVTIDFERDPRDATLFASADPAALLPRLEVRAGARIVPGRTLLFLDEVQAAPDALRALRYLHEERPDLHVIAAGSLLDLTLAEAQVPFPVGRVEFLHLGPMSLDEFLLGTGERSMAEWLGTLRPGDSLPEALHARAMELLRAYLVIGGMPEVVATWAKTRSLLECELVKQSLLSTFEADFAKYGPRVDLRRLSKMFRAAPRFVGQRFKYAHVDRDDRAAPLARALDQLVAARVVHRVRASSGNGVPLAAEADDRRFKVLFLDVGLLGRALGLDLREIDQADDVVAIHAGAIAEQHVGQHLLSAREPHEDPELYFWARELRSSTAEVDYLTLDGTQVIPVEVKSGVTGRLKSLHAFVREKGARLAVRLDRRPPSVTDAVTSLPDGHNVPFRLVSLPLYLAGHVGRIVREQAGL